MPDKLTVLIAVKNHQLLVPDCVRSVLDIADEVLVADSGCTDETISIIQSLCHDRCAVKVVAREYVTAGSFKNWAIPQASHSWVLILDVDERLTDALADEIQNLLARGPAALGGTRGCGSRTGCPAGAPA